MRVPRVGESRTSLRLIQSGVRRRTLYGHRAIGKAVIEV